MKQNTNYDSTLTPNPVTFRPRFGLRRGALLQLAMVVNSIADSPSNADLPFEEVHAAAQQGRLFDLLSQYSGRRGIDLSELRSPDGTFEHLNSAIRLASTALRGQEFLKAGVYRNGYSLVLAIILYVLRERFPQIWPEAYGHAANCVGYE